MTIGGILFDKDGTLLDFNATWVPVIREAALAVAGGDANLAAHLMAAGGQDDSQGTVAPGSLLAAGNTKEIAALWADLAPNHGQRDLIAFIDSLFIEGGKATAVAVPGMAEVLAHLNRDGIRLGLATSDSEAGAVATLAGFGVVELFDFLAGYDSGYGAKPEPGMVEAFCQTTGLKPSEVMVVGDNVHDLEMGRNAGAGHVIGVLTGTGGHEHLAPLADRVIDSIGDLEAVIDDIARAEDDRAPQEFV